MIRVKSPITLRQARLKTHLVGRFATPFYVEQTRPLRIYTAASSEARRHSIARMSTKRKSVHDGRVSPPPMKRKIESTINGKRVSGVVLYEGRQAVDSRQARSVNNFFKPASQKVPDKIRWRTAHDTLLVARYSRGSDDDRERYNAQRRRFAAFDLDGTLIKTLSGNLHSRDGSDWQWWDPAVPGKLRELDEQGYQVIVLSNQGGLSLTDKDSTKVKSDKKRVMSFKERVTGILTHLDLPMSVYAATEKDIFRKPRTGMWKEVMKDYGLDGDEVVELAESVFVGDAGGRVAIPTAKLKVDFASSDRDFADNIGMPFKTPEEFFLGEDPRVFERQFDPATYLDTAIGASAAMGPRSLFQKTNDQDVVLLCGRPASGKSTFYWRHLAPLSYVRINQDTLKTRDKCLIVAEQELKKGNSVAIDNTNADLDVRNRWITLAKAAKVPIRCVWLRADTRLCEHNNAVRALSSVMNPESRALLPSVAFTSFTSRFAEPTLTEGFQDLLVIDFKFDGSDEERAIWRKYWT